MAVANEHSVAPPTQRNRHNVIPGCLRYSMNILSLGHFSIDAPPNPSYLNPIMTSPSSPPTFPTYSPSATPSPPPLAPLSPNSTIPSLPSSPTLSTASSDSDSTTHPSDAEREWRESLQQLELLLTMVAVPYLGKYFGRRCAYWGEFGNLLSSPSLCKIGLVWDGGC